VSSYCYSVLPSAVLLIIVFMFFFICATIVWWIHNLLKRHSSNIFGSLSTSGSDCRWNSLSWRILHLSAELFQYSKNETSQHIVPRTDARTGFSVKFLLSEFLTFWNRCSHIHSFHLLMRLHLQRGIFRHRAICIDCALAHAGYVSSWLFKTACEIAAKSTVTWSFGCGSVTVRAFALCCRWFDSRFSRH